MEPDSRLSDIVKGTVKPITRYQSATKDSSTTKSTDLQSATKIAINKTPPPDGAFTPPVSPDLLEEAASSTKPLNNIDNGQECNDWEDFKETTNDSSISNTVEKMKKSSAQVKRNAGRQKATAKSKEERKGTQKKRQSKEKAKHNDRWIEKGGRRVGKRRIQKRISCSPTSRPSTSKASSSSCLGDVCNIPGPSSMLHDSLDTHSCSFALHKPEDNKPYVKNRLSEHFRMFRPTESPDDDENHRIRTMKGDRYKVDYFENQNIKKMYVHVNVEKKKQSCLKCRKKRLRKPNTVSATFYKLGVYNLDKKRAYCSHCCVEFQNEKDNYGHLCGGKRLLGFQCVFCEKIFKNLKILKEHKKNVHKQDDP